MLNYLHKDVSLYTSRWEGTWCLEARLPTQLDMDAHTATPEPGSAARQVASAPTGFPHGAVKASSSPLIFPCFVSLLFVGLGFGLGFFQFPIPIPPKFL